jgi:hypothetical protein
MPSWGAKFILKAAAVSVAAAVALRAEGRTVEATTAFLTKSLRFMAAENWNDGVKVREKTNCPKPNNSVHIRTERGANGICKILIATQIKTWHADGGQLKSTPFPIRLCSNHSFPMAYIAVPIPNLPGKQDIEIEVTIN